MVWVASIGTDQRAPQTGSSPVAPLAYRLTSPATVIPGIISHQTNVVEHPELVAWRIKNYASVIGKENLIAGADCGFSQYWDSIRVHPTVQWAKLKALADGAALASAELWA